MANKGITAKNLLRRPDLLENYRINMKEQKKWLEEIRKENNEVILVMSIAIIMI